MKLYHLSILVLLMLLSFPISSDAFSRRSHHSEMGPQAEPLNTSQTYGDTRYVSPQAVPEPPVLLLMSVGIGLLAVGAVVKRLRRPHGSPE